MGGATLPTASTPGYGWFRARVACDCLAAWLTAAERLGLARGLIKYELDIVQLTGTASASAGTHSAGGTFDVKQNTREWSHLFREMGAAGWPRTGAGWVNNEHLHGVIDCPHNAPAAYQIPAYWRGYSGLGQATSGTYKGMWGYGSKDPDPWRPTVRRTWREGIAWADAQTKALTAAAQEDDPMAGITLAQIAEQVWEKTKWEGGNGVLYPARSWVIATRERVGITEGIAKQALARVAALEATFKALSAHPDLTPEQITAAAKAGAAAALDERITSADVTLKVDPA